MATDMAPLDSELMLLPMLGRVLLSAFSSWTLWKRRVASVKAGEVEAMYYKTKQTGTSTFREGAADQLVQNLFEAPTAFYAVCIATIAPGGVDHLGLALAGLYVLCRLLHAVEVLGRNSIRRRFRPWVASQFILLGMWLWLTAIVFI